MVVRAGAVMTRAVVCVTPDAPVEHARLLLAESGHGALPVVDDGHRLVGVVTSWDLLHAVSNGATAASVGALMTRDPVWMSGDADVRVLAHRLHHGAQRAMPIAEHGVLVGIVTAGDLLRVHVGVGHRPGPPRVAGRRAACPPAIAADVMVRRGETVVLREDLPVREAAVLLLEHGAAAAPVVDGDEQVVGVVGDLDLVPDVSGGGRAPGARTVGEAMGHSVHGVRDDVGLPDVLRRVVAQRLTVLPVVDRDGRLVGTVTRTDLLRALPSPGWSSAGSNGPPVRDPRPAPQGQRVR